MSRSKVGPVDAARRRGERMALSITKMGQARIAMWKLLVMNDLITKLSTNKESTPSTATPVTLF